MQRFTALVVVACLAVPAAGGIEKVSKSFAFATYKESRGRITILVDSLPASFRDGQPYIPLPVAIGVTGPVRTPGWEV